jgi:hypothetical protein
MEGGIIRKHDLRTGENPYASPFSFAEKEYI